MNIQQEQWEIDLRKDCGTEVDGVFEDVDDLVQYVASQRKQVKEEVIEEIEKIYQCPEHKDNLCGGCDGCNTYQKLNAIKKI
jgi:hypothetical protein